MKKFPVTSDNGIDYEVNVEEGGGYFGETVVRVYERYEGLYRRVRKRRLSKGQYLPEGWDYDFVAMAQNQVRKYENEIAEEIRRKQQQAQGLKAFAEWDGK